MRPLGVCRAGGARGTADELDGWTGVVRHADAASAESVVSETEAAGRVGRRVGGVAVRTRVPVDAAEAEGLGEGRDEGAARGFVDGKA